METLANFMKMSFGFTADLDYIGFCVQLDFWKKNSSIKQKLMWNCKNLPVSM